MVFKLVRSGGTVESRFETSEPMPPICAFKLVSVTVSAALKSLGMMISPSPPGRSKRADKLVGKSKSPKPPGW